MTTEPIEDLDGWWWLHFFDDDGQCLGCCMVHAFGVAHAASEAWRLGINPGGSIETMPFAGFTDPDGVPMEPRPEFRERFIDRAETLRLRDSELHEVMQATG